MATAGAPFTADRTDTTSEASPAQMEKTMLAMDRAWLIGLVA